MKKGISNTAWGRRFKKSCGSGYGEMLKIVRDGIPLYIEKTNERGIWWEYAVKTEDGFWMDCFDLKKDAINFLKWIKQFQPNGKNYRNK